MPSETPAPEELWQAAREGSVERVLELLEQGVAVDAKTEFDCTALYFAANTNQAEVIRVLAKAGADVNVADNSYGFSAISMAGWLGHADAVAALLDAGADPGQAIGAFFAAAGNGHANVVELFLQRKLIPEAQIQAAAGTAANSGAEDVVALLVAAGAKPPAPPSESADADAAVADGEEDAEAANGSETERAEAAAEAIARELDAELDRPRPVAKPAGWPEFRGAGRAGIADGQHPPVRWDLETGHRVVWRRPVAGHGYSSPVIWKGRIYITTSVSPTAEQTTDDGGRGWIHAVDETDEYRWEVHAYDLASGEQVWSRVAHSGVPRSQRHWKASQANPTCATDGRYLVSSFGAEGLFVHDLDGNLKWKKNLGRLNAGWYVDPTFEWGFASSPVLYEGKVIVQVDAHDTAFVAAFDLESGEEVWRTPREELPSWGTPTIYRGETRDELVLNASKAVVAYDPQNGKELWRIRGNSPITVASPIAGDGLIVATGGYRTPRPIYVVAAGKAKGDLTPEGSAAAEGLMWHTDGEGVYIVTPILYRGILYLCKDNGVLTAYDPKTGEQHYRERLGGRYTASPVAADGRIYFTSEDGVVTVVEAGREFRVLAKNELDAATLATPAISNGKLVLRTVKELVAVGFPAAAEEAPAP